MKAPTIQEKEFKNIKFGFQILDDEKIKPIDKL